MDQHNYLPAFFINLNRTLVKNGFIECIDIIYFIPYSKSSYQKLNIVMSCVSVTTFLKTNEIRNFKFN